MKLEGSACVKKDQLRQCPGGGRHASWSV